MTVPKVAEAAAAAASVEEPTQSGVVATVGDMPHR